MCHISGYVARLAAIGTCGKESTRTWCVAVLCPGLVHVSPAAEALQLQPLSKWLTDTVRLVLLAVAGWAVAVVLAGAGVKVEPRGITGPAHSLTRPHHMAVVDLLGVSVLQRQCPAATSK